MKHWPLRKRSKGSLPSPVWTTGMGACQVQVHKLIRVLLVQAVYVPCWVWNYQLDLDYLMKARNRKTKTSYLRKKKKNLFWVLLWQLFAFISTLRNGFCWKFKAFIMFVSCNIYGSLLEPTTLKRAPRRRLNKIRGQLAIAINIINFCNQLKRIKFVKTIFDHILWLHEKYHHFLP